MVYSMPRRRYSPIQSDKHEISWTNLSQDASTVQTITLATGVLAASKNLNTEVLIGTKIYSCYFEFHFSPEATTSAKTVNWKVEKIRTGQTATSPAIMYQDDRRQILKRGMEMLPRDQATVFKRVFVVRIPRSYSNFQQGDVLQFSYIVSSSETINACGIAIYKAIT